MSFSQEIKKSIGGDEYYSPPSDRWFEEHCPRCKWNREWQEDGKSYSECLQGGCTGFEEKECDDTYQEGMCESCDRFEICEKIWEGRDKE